MKTKLLLLSTILLISSAKISYSADVVYNSPETPVYNEALIWGGAYIGGQVGYDWAKTSLNFSDPKFSDYSVNTNGFIGGLYAGYNWELSNAYVLGLEGDVNYADLSQDTNGTFTNVSQVTKLSWNTRVEWEAAVRARFGINYDRWLPYIAGGVAFAGVKDTVTGNFTGIPSNTGNTGPAGGTTGIGQEESNTRVGFTIGAGVDYALTNNLQLRAEYRYSDYGKKDLGVGAESKLTTNNVRLGIAYKF